MALAAIGYAEIVCPLLFLMGTICWSGWVYDRQVVLSSRDGNRGRVLPLVV
jgi:hypothetical protein